MPTLTAEIDLRYLHAALQAASNEVSRYYLNGVLVELRNDTTTYVATDGHILFAMQTERTENCANRLIGDFIIPTEVIKAHKLPPKAKSYMTTVMLSQDTPGLRLTMITLGRNSVTFNAVDGTFPDWRCVVPHVFNPKQDFMAYDPKLLTRLWKAADLAELGTPTLIPNGSSPALVEYTGTAFALVMPMRTNKVEYTHQPTWIAGHKPAEVMAEAAD
jgi:DNA polymerase III sliding clamp (beta) subunit (PCNA family)